jgi:hypothetical protein
MREGFVPCQLSSSILERVLHAVLPRELFTGGRWVSASSGAGDRTSRLLSRIEALADQRFRRRHAAERLAPRVIAVAGGAQLRKKATPICAARWSTVPAPSVPISVRNRIPSADGSEP